MRRLAEISAPSARLKVFDAAALTSFPMSRPVQNSKFWTRSRSWG